MELNLRFLIHSNAGQLQDDVLTDQEIQEGDLLVGDHPLEIHMIKEKRHNTSQQEVISVKRSDGKLLEMYIFEDLKHRTYDLE